MDGVDDVREAEVIQTERFDFLAVKMGYGINGLKPRAAVGSRSDRSNLAFEWPPLSGGGHKIFAVPKIGAPSIAALSADPKLPICSRRDRGHESAHQAVCSCQIVESSSVIAGDSAFASKADSSVWSSQTSVGLRAGQSVGGPKIHKLILLISPDPLALRAHPKGAPLVAGDIIYGRVLGEAVFAGEVNDGFPVV